MIPKQMTKTETIETFWFEFLQYIKALPENEVGRNAHPTDNWFWRWYVDNKMEVAK